MMPMKRIRRATAARVRHASDENLGPNTDWHRRKLREHLKPTSGVVTVLGEDDPGVFDGLPPERVVEMLGRLIDAP